MTNIVSDVAARPLGGSSDAQDLSLSPLARLLAVAYLRLLATRDPVARNSACSPSVAVDPKRQNLLDVAAQQSDELDGHVPRMRPKCKQT